MLISLTNFTEATAEPQPRKKRLSLIQTEGKQQRVSRDMVVWAAVCRGRGRSVSGAAVCSILTLRQRQCSREGSPRDCRRFPERN